MATKSTDSATRKAVVDYYDGSWFDYRVIWMDRGNLAKHFGYWEPDTRNHSQSLTNMNRQVAARVNPKPGERVLDAGCGIGGSSMWLARTFGVNTVGISLSANELERARRYAKAKGLEDQCTFQQEDFIATSFPDESFDIVWAQESVCHTIHKDAFCAEAYRLLKPGGRMVMEDWFRPGRPYDAKDERLFSDWLRGWAIEDLATREEITGYAADAGFENVLLEDITPYMLRSARHLYMVTAALYPGAVLLRALKLRTKVLHENMISARLQWRAHVRNLWFAGILSAQKPLDAASPKPTKAQSAKSKPKTEKPKTEKPKTEKPKTEKPKTEKPKTALPKTAKPKTAGPSKAPKKDTSSDVAGAAAPAADHSNMAESSNGHQSTPAEGASADRQSREPGEQNETKGDDDKS